MPLKNVPIKQPANEGGVFTNIWVLFFNEVKKLLDNSQPQQVPAYTVSTVPAAASYTGYVIYVSNETGGAVLAFSDGTNWRRVTDRNIVS